MQEEYDRIDLFQVMHFFLENKKIYLISIILGLALSLIWGIRFRSPVYECRAVLYYPEKASSEAEHISDRELMDDMAEILKQKRILEPLEEKTGTGWETIRQNLTVTVNAETGIVDLTVRGSTPDSAYGCANALLDAAGKELKEIIPVGDLIPLQEPELPDRPVDQGSRKELAAGCAAGVVFASAVSMLKRGYRKDKNHENKGKGETE